MEKLLSDDVLLQKSKIWSDAMAKFCEAETFKEIEFHEIQSDSEENSDDETPNETIVSDTNENNCKALVKVENFEGATSSDDFEECANETVTLMKEHQDKWEKCGMMKVLETFDWDQISKVVTPWVEQNKLDKSQLSTSVDEHIVHIEEHHHRQVHVASDDDSLHSLDTANYIRANRKIKRSSCTTTTIKKFSYIKGSRSQLAKKFGLGNLGVSNNLNSVFEEKYPQNIDKIARRALKNSVSPEKRNSLYFTPPARLNAITYESKSLPAPKRRSRQMKRRSDISKRSVSSSSSSSDSQPRPSKPKFRKSYKANGEDVNKLDLVESHQVKRKVNIDLTNLETSESEAQMPPKKSVDFLQIPQPELHKANQGASSSNETGFLGASIVNSTALSNTNPPPEPNPIKKCLITPIKSKPNQKPQTAKSKQLRRVKKKKADEKDAVEPKEIEKTITPEDTSKILLFCPTNLEPHKKNLSGKLFYLTREYFLEKVGKKNSRRFIKLNSKKFPFEFNCSSTIFFKVPDESEDSASSDEDILYIFGREGKLIVETVEQRNAKV